MDIRSFCAAGEMTCSPQSWTPFEHILAVSFQWQAIISLNKSMNNAIQHFGLNASSNDFKTVLHMVQFKSCPNINTYMNIINSAGFVYVKVFKNISDLLKAHS